NRSLLAAQPARRRSGARSAVPPASRSRPVHSLLRPGAGRPGNSRPARPRLLSESFAALVSIPAAPDAAGARAVRPRRVRPRDQQRIRPGERSPRPLRCAARLLLPYPHALFVGPLSGVPARVDARLEASADGAARELFAALGLRDGAARR